MKPLERLTRMQQATIGAFKISIVLAFRNLERVCLASDGRMERFVGSLGIKLFYRSTIDDLKGNNEWEARYISVSFCSERL